MKVIAKEEVPRLAGAHIINFDGGYLGHREPCDNPDHFKVRYQAGDGDVIRTYEKDTK